jgi:adenosylcobyric acid synthase
VAAGVEPEAAMNPVLLKPGGDRRSHVVVMGRPGGTIDSKDFVGGRTHLRDAAYAAFDDLASRHDLVVVEGAGSPAEINLREGDYVNMGLAQHGRVPTLVVGDIDRGGVFAALFGTVALLSAPTVMFIMSPKCGPAGFCVPCIFVVGFQWPPAVVNAGASHVPVM